MIRLHVESDVEIVAYPSAPASAGITVVLLHGIGMSHLTWAELQPLLADSGRVISFDMPGFGTARTPDRPFGVVDFADAVDAALTMLGVRSCVVVGHSMGAQFAVELAARSPGLVAGLVLVGPVVVATRRTVRAQALSLALDSLREPPRVNGRVLTDYLKGGVGWYLSTLGPMLDYPIEQRIRDTACPVVVMRGERDSVAPLSWCELLASNAPAWSAVVSVPGKAHVIPLTAPIAVAEAVGTVVGRSRQHGEAQRS